MSTLVIIPTYNEASNIEAAITAVRDNTDDADILVIDDGSPDGTGSIVNCLISNNKSGFLHLIERKRKGGLASAYIAGFRWGLERDYRYLVEMDADLSHDASRLPVMIAAAEEGNDFIIGSRYVKGGAVRGWGIIRTLLSRGGSIYSRIVLGCPIKDFTGGYNLWSREVLQTLNFDDFLATGYLFQIEMKYRSYKAGYRFLEIPFIFKDREEGLSKMSGGIFSEALRQVWALKRELK